MNNTASLRRTSLRERLEHALSGRMAPTVIATALLTVILISFKPFEKFDPLTRTGGDAVNQLGFGLLGAVSIFSLLAFADRRMLAGLLSPWWLLMLAFFMLSVFNADDPSSAMRTAAFTLIGIMTMAVVLTLPRDADSFSTALAVAGFSVVGLCYVGLVIYPDLARHTADSLEPEHAGLWRGLYSHKNVAGPVMASLSFAGLYLFRRGWHWAGGLLFILALFFMSNTGSKTTAGLVPLAIILVIGPSIFGLRRLAPLVFALALGGAAIGTVGIVLSPALWDMSQAIAPGLTYTGRTSLWIFLLEHIAQRPWTGFGYESFWGTMRVFTTDQPFDRDWDIRGIVHGHNGYLDLAVLMGLPALAVAIITFILAPLRDFLRVPRLRENVLVADFFLMILLFTALNALLESFFFRRADPVWLFFILATLGLRQAARFPMATRVPD